ncbi:unknown protein [Bathycoccus prasinos]|uniref:Uncharacterized protein n=1 Tax=Bathycoccus prasinos TaxID=41875 RepID=K8EIM7_9CHLO|nr:unknown protein [Bathycoccus prasinos]CCO17861.1 unknown protein [Bathycoccus prasinos]|eukprot:XP_007511740.1 unknown protein [Bathycoccus prasinos]
MSSAKDNNNDVDDDDTIDEDEIDDWLDSDEDDEDNTKKKEEEKEETLLNAVEKQEQERERKRNEQEEEEEEDEEKREREEEREKQRREQVELEARRAAEIAAARKKQEEEEAEAKRRQFQEQEKRLREEKAKAELEATRQMEEERREREETLRKEVAGRDTEAASFEAKKSEQATIEVLDAVGERNNAHHHQPPNEFDELAQSSTVVGGLFGSFKALKSAASKTVTAMKSHEFTRQMTSDIRELSKHIAGDDVAAPSTKIPTTTELGEDDRTRQRARDEVDALEIAEKLASKTWHAIGGITNKGKKLASDVEGSIKEKGLGATAEKYGKSALFGIEKVLANATKVIAAGIEDETRANSRLAENLQEYGVFEYLDAIDVKTKDAEEKFKALDFEAANFMAKACADILSPAQSQEMGSPLKINTNQEFEEMDMHNHEAETSPVKKSGKIHAQKVAESVQRVSALLQDAMRKPDESATKKALNMIEIAESELEGVRESAIVAFTELTVFGMQQFEEVSEALSKDEIDVSRWGSTVESRAKYVETTICRVENEIRLFRNAVSTEVEALGAFSTNAGGNIPTVLEVVASLLDDIDNDLLECLDIFEDAKGMIIPAIVVSCL